MITSKADHQYTDLSTIIPARMTLATLRNLGFWRHQVH